MSQLDALRKMLNDANVTDDMISRGVRLTHKGTAKIAGKFGVSEDEVAVMLKQLAGEDSLTESEQRYTYESDFLKNVTIRDNKTGDEKNIVGSEAFKLLAEIERLGDYQALLSAYFARSLNEAADEEIDDMDAEIASQSGTYNFPFKNFFATARFADHNGKFTTRVISIRDAMGEEQEIDEQMRRDAEAAALRWVHKV